MARRKVIVRYGLFRRSAGWVVAHPYWTVALLAVATLVRERGW